MPNFQQEHFTRANKKERIRKLTAQTTGHHGAHSAVVVPPAGAKVAPLAGANAAAVTPPPSATTAPPSGNGAMSCCCWMHGLGKNKCHTSAQCKNKAEGHKDSATAADMQEGSNNKVMTRRRAKPSAPSKSNAELAPIPVPAISPPPTVLDSTPAIADGCTANFCTTGMPVHNKRLATEPIAIRNPNSKVMCSTCTTGLHLPGLPLAARQVHIVPSLASQSLLSIGQFCDAGCKVVFDSHTVTISHNSEVLLTGQRTALTRLWHLDIPSVSPDESPIPQADPATGPKASPIEQADSAIGLAMPAELLAFAHAALFSLALSTPLVCVVQRIPHQLSRFDEQAPSQMSPTIRGNDQRSPGPSL
jgi:hypothetical protein